MKIPAQYRRPILIAVALHVALIVFLIVRLSPTLYRAPNAYQPKPFDSIKAVAIMSQPVITPTPKPTPTPTPTPAPPTPEQTAEKLEQQQVRSQLAEKRAEQQARKLAAEKLQKIAQLQAQALQQQKIKKEQALAAHEKIKLAQKTAALKLQQQKLAKQKTLAAEQKKLQQTMMQQQLNNEQKDLSQIQTKATTGQLDQYKAQILALIQSNWRIDQVNSQLKCVYSVEVAPDGEVLSAQLMKSSGNDALDQSAREAIMASSPLPVPKTPELFSHFRQLVLTLSPQGYLQSVGSA